MGGDGGDEMERLFDPDVLPLISELEGGPADAAELSRRTGVPQGEVGARLSYLVSRGFVRESGGDPPVYEADAGRLAGAMEREGNYQTAVDGLTKLDGFLN